MRDLSLWLSPPLPKYTFLVDGTLYAFLPPAGSVLVFVTKKADSELVADKMKSRGIPGMLYCMCYVVVLGVVLGGGAGCSAGCSAGWWCWV